MPGCSPWRVATAPAVMPRPHRGNRRVVTVLTIDTGGYMVRESRRGSAPLTTARNVESAYMRVSRRIMIVSESLVSVLMRLAGMGM